MPKLSKRRTESARVEDPRDRRQEILIIAAGLFTKRGFDGVSVREIADAAGIMGGSLYHHFASKKEIYLEVHSAALRRAAEVVNEQRQQDYHQDADDDPDQEPHEPWDPVPPNASH